MDEYIQEFPRSILGPRYCSLCSHGPLDIIFQVQTTSQVLCIRCRGRSSRVESTQTAASILVKILAEDSNRRQRSQICMAQHRKLYLSNLMLTFLFSRDRPHSEPLLIEGRGGYDTSGIPKPPVQVGTVQTGGLVDQPSSGSEDNGL